MDSLNSNKFARITSVSEVGASSANTETSDGEYIARGEARFARYNGVTTILIEGSKRYIAIPADVIRGVRGVKRGARSRLRCQDRGSRWYSHISVILSLSIRKNTGDNRRSNIFTLLA